MRSTVLVLTSWFVASASVGNACTIDSGGAAALADIEGTYLRSDAVLVGEIVGVTPIDSGWAKVTFRVAERLKRDVGEQISLAAQTGLIGCNPHIEMGTRYIVFARNRPTTLPVDSALPDDAAVARPTTVEPTESPAFGSDTFASSPGEATAESRGEYFIDNPTIANLRGIPPAVAPSVPWEGDFILRVTAEVDSTSATYSERIGAALDKLRALRAEEVKGGE